MTFLTCVNFDAFTKQNGSFIFPQNRGAHKRSFKFIRKYYKKIILKKLRSIVDQTIRSK